MRLISTGCPSASAATRRQYVRNRVHRSQETICSRTALRRIRWEGNAAIQRRTASAVREQVAAAVVSRYQGEKKISSTPYTLAVVAWVAATLVVAVILATWR